MMTNCTRLDGPEINLKRSQIVFLSYLSRSGRLGIKLCEKFAEDTEQNQESIVLGVF